MYKYVSFSSLWHFGYIILLHLSKRIGIHISQKHPEVFKLNAVAEQKYCVRVGFWVCLDVLVQLIVLSKPLDLFRRLLLIGWIFFEGYLHYLILLLFIKRFHVPLLMSPSFSFVLLRRTSMLEVHVVYLFWLLQWIIGLFQVYQNTSDCTGCRKTHYSRAWIGTYWTSDGIYSVYLVPWHFCWYNLRLYMGLPIISCFC